MFAKYWDHVDDPREISGVSRFLSGGIGGISSQLCKSRHLILSDLHFMLLVSLGIYPVETLKVRHKLKVSFLAFLTLL